MVSDFGVACKLLEVYNIEVLGKNGREDVFIPDVLAEDIDVEKTAKKVLKVY